MDIYMRRIFERDYAEVLKENAELKKQKTQRHLLISELIEILISHGISIADIAEETNIPYDLLQSFASTT